MDKSYKEIYNKNQRQYWVNFWYFNKKIIYACLVATFMLIYGVVSCSISHKPDAGIILITKSGGISGDKTDLIKTEYSKFISDVNDDRVATLNVVGIYFYESAPGEVDAANAMRLSNELINGDCNVIIAEKSTIKHFLSNEKFFATPFESKYPIIYDNGGNAAALDISKSAFAEKIEYKGTEPLCLAYIQSNPDSPLYDMFEEGKKLAKEISQN